MQVLICSIGSQVCGMLVAGGFCYGRLLDESCIARESQNSPDSCACLRPSPQRLFSREARQAAAPPNRRAGCPALGCGRRPARKKRHDVAILFGTGFALRRPGGLRALGRLALLMFILHSVRHGRREAGVHRARSAGSEALSLIAEVAGEAARRWCIA